MKFFESKTFKIISIIIAFFMLVLVGLLLYIYISAIVWQLQYSNMPWNQNDTVWVSDDSKVTIEIYDNKMYGTVIVDGEKMEINFFHHYEFLEMYVSDAEGGFLESIVQFKGWYYSEDEFFAKVTQTYVPYFKEGQKITFQRVDG